MAEPLPPGSVIGILGGGQLGRMLAMAAARLGLRAHVYAPPGDAPACEVAADATRAAWNDEAALTDFARAVDIATLEFENVPASALTVVARHAPVRPDPRAVDISADRLEEKRFLTGLGCATAPFAPANAAADLAAAGGATGWPAILKTRRFGYDGKGQMRLDGSDGGVDVASPSILEGVVAFDREVSVLVARDLDGVTATWEPGENVHRDGILRTTTLPAKLSPDRADEARTVAIRIAEALDYVGVLGVEMFDTGAGLVVNEIAPRVHNSGHWTEDAAVTSQFAQHVRAVAGWPLGDTRRIAPVVMENLIGEDLERMPEILAQAGAVPHLYGKAQVRPGRKMGHVNRLGPG